MTAKKANRNLFDWFKPIYGLMVISLLLSACGGKQPEKVEPTLIAPLSPTATASPSSTPIPQPSVLNICTAQEPVSLYRYDGRNSESKKTIFSALYGQVIMEADQISGLLERMPTVENGDVKVLSIEVATGDVIVDAHGWLSVLKQGSEVIPDGCASTDCVIAWDGESGLTLTYLEIRYQLKDDLKWSDGEPLTAADVMFAYQIASDEMTPTDKPQFELTDRVSVEGNTFVWTGAPGLVNQNAEHGFWLPLPKHQLESFSAVELLDHELATIEPLSWGAYRLIGWEKGARLLFESNPFFRSTDPTSKTFDSILINIITNQEAALDAFNSGMCDVLDTSYALEAIPAGQHAGTSHVLKPFEVGTLVFGVNPGSYDDGHAAWEDERADYLGDIRTRQAIALCIDPVDLSAQLSADWQGVSGTVLTVNAPILPDIDPNALLESVGWIDNDGDPITPRVSSGNTNVTDLTPFEINLYSGQSAMDTKAAAEIGERLGACSIKVNVSNLPATQLYAPGPEGILFGRQFDLAIVNWAGNTGIADQCAYYLSNQVPSAANNWVGTNLAGYRDSVYDIACLTTLAAAESKGTTLDNDLLNPLVALNLVPRFKVWVSRDVVLP